MTSKFRPAGSGWAIIVLSLSALALAGCGRKGPLDLPPTASNASTANIAAPTDTETEAQKTPERVQSDLWRGCPTGGNQGQEETVYPRSAPGRKAQPIGWGN
ncbi:putative small lipoprotein YifL [Bradyrhizobium sp. GM24.11]